VVGVGKRVGNGFVTLMILTVLGVWIRIILACWSLKQSIIKECAHHWRADRVTFTLLLDADSEVMALDNDYFVTQLSRDAYCDY
jgi:hypothetical protein